MASTYTTRNRFEKQAVGENQDTWGTRLNTQVIDMMDEALDGYISIDVAGSGDYTLSANNGATDESRQRVIFLTGALTGTRNIVMPAVEGWRIFWNGTTGNYDLNIKASGGTSTKLPKGQMGMFICYGSSTDNLLPGVCGWDQEAYAVASGTDTYTATLVPDPGEYLLGETVHIKFTNANTGAATLNLNSNGAKAIQRDGSALTAGEIKAGSVHELVYDGTQFQLTGVSNLTSKLVGTIATAQIANSAVTTAKIADNNVTGAKIAMGSDAAGDVLYYNGTDYARLPAGTSSQFLQGGTTPAWASPIGTGAFETQLLSVGQEEANNTGGGSLTVGDWRTRPINTEYVATITDAGLVYDLQYDNNTADFTAGQIVTGGTSSATARIVAVSDAGASGTLSVINISGTFQNDEALTDPLGGAADANIPSGVSTTDQIYLPAGTYYMQCEQMIQVLRASVRFYDVTNTTAILHGVNIQGNGYSLSARTGCMSGKWTAAGAALYEFQAECNQTNNTNGWGWPANVGNTEVYHRANIWKLD